MKIEKGKPGQKITDTQPGMTELEDGTLVVNGTPQAGPTPLSELRQAAQRSNSNKAIILPTVEKTSTMLKIEKANGGRDIRLIIADLYEKHGVKTKVAEELGIDQSLLFTWALRLGISFDTRPIATINGKQAA